MDDKTLAALTTLAQKLGTTGDYLWGVLVKQAPLSGALDLVVFVLWVVWGVWWFRFVQRKTTVPVATDKDRCPEAQWSGDGRGLAWILTCTVFAVFTAMIGFNAPSAIAAIVNPEYWALKQVLGLLK